MESVPLFATSMRIGFQVVVFVSLDSTLSTTSVPNALPARSMIYIKGSAEINVELTNSITSIVVIVTVLPDTTLFKEPVHSVSLEKPTILTHRLAPSLLVKA